MKKLPLISSLFLTLFFLTFSNGLLLASPTPKSNFGKEFFFSFPANWEFSSTIKYIRLYITATTRTKVNISIGSMVLKTLYTTPYEVITYDLTNLQGQIFVRSDATPIPDDQVYKDRAVHITSAAPICVYGINRASFTSDGMMILPTTALGKDYVVATSAEIGTSQRMPAQFMIIAPFDSTEVVFTLPKSQSTPNHLGGVANKILLDKGDVFSAMSDAPLEDLTGTRIVANKPVAVTAGNMCTYLPDGRYTACDHICEMMLPVESWGKAYYALPFATRKKTDMFRVIASEDSTTIYVNGTKLVTLQESMYGNNKGNRDVAWVEYLHYKREPLAFTADKPISVVQYNCSQNWDNVISDPFMMCLNSTINWQNEILFSTPSGGDFPGMYINLVLDASEVNKIEILKAGDTVWRKLKESYRIQEQYFNTPYGGINYAGLAFEIKPGTYRIRCMKPFSAYIYGFGSYDSFGYPLNGSYNLLNQKDKVAPVITKNMGCIGKVQATATDLPNDATIRSNISSVDLDFDNSNNYDLVVKDFVIGQTKSINYTLNVIDPNQPASAIVLVSDYAGNYVFDTVNYLPVEIASKSQISFNNLKENDKIIDSVDITNLAKNQFTLKNLKLKKGNVGFKIISPTTNILLDKAGNPNSTVFVKIEFSNANYGKYSDSLGFEDECYKTFFAPLNAEVLGCSQVAFTDANFGVVTQLNIDFNQSVKCINNSTNKMDLLISEIKGPFGTGDNAVFSLANSIPRGKIIPPISVSPSQQYELLVLMRARKKGVYKDSLIIVSNACGANQADSVVYLYGQTDSNIASVNETSEIQNLQIYPNPAKGIFYAAYKLNKSELVSVKIYDINGKIVFETKPELKTAGENLMKFDIGNLSKGIYNVEVHTSNKKTIRKVSVN